LSNLFGPLFPHFPNFNTLRGDKYRFPVPYMKNSGRSRLLADAHQTLLKHGGDVSFWGNGWLETELVRWQKLAGE